MEPVLFLSAGFIPYAYVAYRDDEIFQSVTKEFLCAVMKETRGLGIAVAAIETDLDKHYKEDFRKLNERLSAVKGSLNHPAFMGNQPITKQSARTGNPVSEYCEEEMQLQGFNMVRCIQGAKTLSLPMQMFGADLKAHKVIYNNNPILKWCLTNTGVQSDRNGNIVHIKNQSPKQRIDGTVALLDCYVGLYEHYNEYTGVI